MRKPTRFSALAGGLILASVTALGGCRTLDPLEPDRPTVERHPSGDRMRIRAPFDDVWPKLLEIMQRRGYADLDTERETVSETYQTSVEVEDQPRDKVLRENVDEGRGRISATTDEQKRVAFTLIEEHGWDSSTLSIIVAATGGDEDRHLEHKGVEVSVADHGGAQIDYRESKAVLDALAARFTAGD